MSLSPQQRAAVERTEQDVCVVAGPGSGKTTVLVERFAWLVEHCGISPDRILAITFTEKAANEMKRRLVNRLKHRPDLREAVERAWLSTIDGFCARLLRENAIAAGLPPDFAVLDQSAADRMKREATEHALDELFVENPDDMRRLMEALDLSTEDDARQPDLAGSLIDVYESMRLSAGQTILSPVVRVEVLPEARRLVLELQNAPLFRELHDWTHEFLALASQPVSLEHFRMLQGFKVDLTRGSKSRGGYSAATQLKKKMLPELAAQWIEEFYEGLPDLLQLSITRLDSAYREIKREQAVVDFADLEERAIELLESAPELRERIANQFDQVLMDELQDTNRLQWRLVNLVKKDNGHSFFAVGDINQSIYGFRHADRKVFEEYRTSLRSAGHVIDELDENYRSRQGILDTVSRTLNAQSGIEPRILTAQKQFGATVGPVVERLVGTGDNAADVEAGLVAARIQEWFSRGRALGDFAILVRALSATGPFERALDRFHIPFLVSGGRTFLEARETRDLMALLAALVNPLDDIALLGVLRSPLMGWADEKILKAGRPGRVAEFEKVFGRLRRLAGFVAPDRLLAMALDECGYLAPLSDRARANVDKLLAWMRREHRNHPRPLAELLEDVEALRTTQAEAEAPPPEAANAVRIMTMHAAKGLEFPVVFVSALHKGPDRRTPVLLFSAASGLGAKWRNPVTGEGVSGTVHAALASQSKLEEAAEENRLLYVAMTRAEDRLILSYAQRRNSSAWQKLVDAAIPAGTEADHVPKAPAEGLSYIQPTSDHTYDAPKISGQHDSSASVTAVASFDACPRKYYLGRYLGLEVPPVGQAILSPVDARELGSEVHRALASGHTDSPEASELAERFKLSELGQRALRARRIQREFDFLLPLEDVVLNGRIDLWFEDAGELILADYKTDRDELSSGEHAVQLRLYALALERYEGRLPDRAALCYLRSGRVVDVSLAPAELDAAKAIVGALAMAQDTLTFPMKAGEQCNRCEFYKVLCQR